MSHTVRLSKRLGRSIRLGHPWIYRDALAPVTAPGPRDGGVVSILDEKDAPVAWGYWDRRSPIAVRVMDRAPVPGHDVATELRRRLTTALGTRTARLDLAATNAFRWVHGEADALPGVHVDLYDDVAMLRYDGTGARAFYQALPALLASTFAHLRPGSALRVLDRERHGALRDGTLQVLENGLRFQVNLDAGQKGGLFLDQRDNRAAVAKRAAGRSVLNLFGYTGGFSIYAAAAGAARTDTVDLAAPAIEAARDNFRANGLDPGNAGFFAEDAFTFLERAAGQGRRWDIVISDPPSFAPSERAVPQALRAYRRLHGLCARVVGEGGLYCPASCSSHVDRAMFMTTVAEGARDAGRRFDMVAFAGAGFDHPVLPAFPEGDYLKFAIGTLA